jgi:hypothetical protein
MRRPSTILLRIALLATIVLAASAAGTGRLRAQHAIQPSAAQGATTPRTAPVAGSASHTVREARTPAQSKSLSQKIFDTSWVLFPTRLAVVIVLLAVAALFLMSGCWGAVRLAHLLRHLEWKEPPRRLKRGELGAAGASVAFEFEERLNTKHAEDEERDRQIAWLRTTVLRLTEDHNRTAAALAMFTEPGGTGFPHGEANDVG